MKLNLKYSNINEKDLLKYKDKVKEISSKMHNKTSLGSEFLGWLNYSETLTKEILDDIKTVSKEIRENADVLLVLGIGGSYLGAKAFISALENPYKKKLEIIFCANTISSENLIEIMDYIKDKSVYLNVISKSGRTLETAIGFRVLKEYMQNNFKDYNKRIIATTDKDKGALRELVQSESYRSFIINDDIGGRYSVFSPVGLLPIACSGIDIYEIYEALKEAENEYKNENVLLNEAFKYAVIRNIYYKNNLKIEVLVNYDLKLSFLNEWYKQLFGESEGKNNLGIFPASVINSTDLHSMGQYIQDGERILFETVIDFKKSDYSLLIKKSEDNLDGLNYLENKSFNEVNQKALLATVLAHKKGGVNNIIIEVEKKDTKNLTKLMYFFMISCAMSGYLLGVNPFDQPGVEDYKDNMFALLNKPGTEDKLRELKKLM